MDRNPGFVQSTSPTKNVALRKESVDRNQYLSGVLDFAPGVALRKESVDRNGHGVFVLILCLGRSPQGERG